MESDVTTVEPGTPFHESCLVVFVDRVQAESASYTSTAVFITKAARLESNCRELTVTEGVHSL